MRFPLPTAVLLCGLLLCGMAHAEPTACQRFEQQYAKQYDSILCVSEQTAIVGKRKLGTALADSQNRLLVPFSRDNWITPSSDHQDMQLLFIRRQNKKGVIDINGKPVLPPQYDDIYIPEEIDAPIVIINHSPDGQLEGLADREGRILIEPRYYLIDRFYHYYQLKGDKGTTLSVNGKNFRPDGIFFCESVIPDKPLFTYIVEIHRHSDRRRIIQQLLQHVAAIKQGSMKNRFDLQTPYFVLSVFTDENLTVMRSVIKELQTFEEWTYIKSFFMFARLEDLMQDFYKGCAYFGGDKKPLPPRK